MWLRSKVARVTQACSRLAYSSFDWVVMVDDDTHVRPSRMALALRSYATGDAAAVGARHLRPNDGVIGGGPGIAMNLACLERLAVGCGSGDASRFPVFSKAIAGGDGWLGQCFAAVGCRTVNDWGFKFFPPWTFDARDANRSVSFHRTPPTLGDAWEETAGADVASYYARAAADERCVPMHHPTKAMVVCLPQFLILGAQKAATTSLFSYLGQHPDVSKPINGSKELNFWGSPWPVDSRSGDKYAKKRRVISDVLLNYVPLFRAANYSLARDSGDGPGNVSLTGEASPDYLVSVQRGPYNLVRYAPATKLIVCRRQGPRENHRFSPFSRPSRESTQLTEVALISSGTESSS